MLEAGGPWVLVDLSNLCRDERLCRRGHRADLRAFDRLIEALGQDTRRFGRVRAVADRSLFRYLDANDKQRLRGLESDGVVVVTPMADPTLIEAAFSPRSPFLGALIVSRDGFADFRIDYPEIQGSKDRFLDWEVKRNGGLAVRFRDMGHFTHMRISRKVEEGDFKDRKMFNTIVRDRAVRQRYRCASSDCLLAKLWPESLPQLPEYDRREDCFVCPGCGGKLEVVGTRPPSTQLVVFAAGAEVCRILLEEGDRFVIGRDDRSNCIGLSKYVSDTIATEISRKHLAVALVDGMVLVSDLGSKNGSQMETRKGRFERVKLEPGEDYPLGRANRVRLASDVVVELSGRRNPFDGVRLDQQHTRAGIDMRQTATGG